MRLLSNVPKVEARAALLALLVGIALTALKFLAYFLTGSTVVLSDALESIVNVAAAGFAAYALSVAHTPADESHPYGHGKIEFLSAAFEGGMMLLAAIVAAVKAVSDFIHGPTVESHPDIGVALLCLALLSNGVMGWLLIRIGRRQRSLTLEADGQHLLSDAVTSIVAIAGLTVVLMTRWPFADPLAALLVCGYIAWIGLRLIRRASAGLMDQQDTGDEQLLRRILDSHLGENAADPKICSYHKLRHRHSGRFHWVDFHMVVPSHWDIERGHRIASRIEYEIEQALGEGNATAHVEPCHDNACSACGSNVEPEASIEK